MATIASSPSPATRDLSGLSAQVWKAATLGLFAAWVLIIGAAHEPWFDEAQSWLLARDNGIYDLLFERVRYEGSPGLWHVILWAAIRCGLPYAQLHLVSAAVAIGGAAIVLWRAPFPPWMRVAIVFSYFFAFQYSVIARSYSADLLLVPLVAAWFAERGQKPVRYAIAIGLLANLNTHGFVAAAVLGLELFVHLMRQGKLRSARCWAAVCLAAGMGLFALFCAWQPADNAFLRARRPPLELVIEFVRQGFVDRLAVFSINQATPTEAAVGFVVTLIALIPSAKMMARSEARLASVGAIAALVAFSATVHAASWHSGLLFLLWMFGMWVCWPHAARETRRQAAAAFAFIAALQFVQGMRSGEWDLTNTFSPAREAALFVDQYKAGHSNARVAAFGYKTFALQPYWTSNGFSNYKNGAPGSAWLDWRFGEPWDPFSPDSLWEKTLNARPELIVASLATFEGRSDRLFSLACKAGYAETRRFKGALLWRGARHQDDTIAIFERGVSAECPGGGVMSAVQAQAGAQNGGKA